MLNLNFEQLLDESSFFPDFGHTKLATESSSKFLKFKTILALLF